MAAVRAATATTGGAIVAALSASVAVISYFIYNYRSKASMKDDTHLHLSNKKKLRKGLVDAIGNTPLIRINSLSDATGCEILGKAEFLNPGGSVKDRVAVKIIEEALEFGQLSRGGVVTEGSAGSTAISLDTDANAMWLFLMMLLLRKYVSKLSPVKPSWLILTKLIIFGPWEYGNYPN